MHAVLSGDVASVAADDEVVFGFEAGLIGQGGGTFIINIFNFSFCRGDDGFAKSLTVDVHARGVRLHDGGVAEAVDDEAGQTVAFAVNEAEDVVAVAPREVGRLPDFQCGGDAAYPEFIGNLDVLEG